MDERDIWRTALAMVKRYGDNAGVDAALRADRFAADGNDEGARLWRRIQDAIRFLTPTEWEGGRSVETDGAKPLH